MANQDLIGNKFGQWTIVCISVKNKFGKQLYTCVCSCGVLKDHAYDSLRDKQTTRCKKCQMKEINQVEDIVGKTFYSWTVLERTNRKSGTGILYVCKCRCGSYKDLRGSVLKSGRSKKCIKCSHNKTHGMANSKTFSVWRSMLARCYNNKNISYIRYGGRGITVCESWRFSFENFISDMGIQPIGLQIDRIDNDGNYEPLNCRWVTPKQNCNNRGNSKP